jgi:sec-independent protein translocase protein TatC
MIKYFLELKNRTFLLFTTIIFSLLISYIYKETLLFLLVQPERLGYTDKSSSFYFIFTNVTEVFYVYINLITFLNIQLFFIFLLYQCFIFLSPAMFKSEYYKAVSLIKLSFIVWVFSALISNFILVPLSWDFFSSFQELFSSKIVKLHFEAKLTEYLEFYVLIYYFCVTYFQVFTILFFFLNYLNEKMLIIKKFRKVYYYFFVIFSTLLSPPDLVSQILISLLLIFMYEFLVFGIVIKSLIR